MAGFPYQSLPGTGGGASADSEDLLGADRADSTQVGFNQLTNMNPSVDISVDNGQTFWATLANPYPDGFIAAQRSSAGLAINLGLALSSVYPQQPLARNLL